MVALQDSCFVDVNVLCEFWNGAESAPCRFFCERAPCAKCDVMPHSCEKTHTRTWLAGSGANCAHGHNLLLQRDERQGRSPECLQSMSSTADTNPRANGGKLSAAAENELVWKRSRRCAERKCEV